MSAQLPLAIGSSPATKRANKISRKAHRKRLPIYQPSLPVDDSGFADLAREGVPKTRGECPVVRPCPYVRCRHHLFLVDADTRAGRPGLASVPRDAKGLTLAVAGDAGTAGPGTTLRPGWLKVRGLEIEREVKVYVTQDENGYTMTGVQYGMLEAWTAALLDDEPVLVYAGNVLLASAVMREGALRFNRELPEYALRSADPLTLERVRQVASCALDEAERGRLSNAQIGARLGRHRTTIAPIVMEAGRKLVEEGVDLRDVVEAMEGL